MSGKQKNFDFSWIFKPNQYNNIQMSIKIIAVNKKSSFSYFLLDKFEAGLMLKGTEIKSIRKGGCQLKDSYIAFKKQEAFLQNAYIAPYKPANQNNHEPERLRKLLLNRHELNKLQGALQKKGLTCVPTKIYLKNGRAKLEIALARGKKHWDKRESAKKKNQEREIARRLRR